MRWYEKHRLEWIDETIRVFGFINRVHLQRKFGLSVPQASKDLQIYQKLHPNKISYCLSDKCYRKKN